MKHRGLLHALRLHPLARLGAVLALYTYVFIGLSPLWVPAVERGGIEVCTANGIQLIPGDQPFSGAPDGKQKPKKDCPLCRILTAFLLAPVDCVPEAFDRGVSTFPHFHPSRDIAGLYAGFDHLSRAPPVLS
ncbi:MAG: hypothetical protein IPK66_10030 [Rhodospirillales bacterium]|nr:hypothetical protein [Rhodospirillales bacterium]